MTLTKVHQGQKEGKRGWTAFELILLTPFVLLFIYIATEPLVLSERAADPRASLVAIPMQAAQAAEVIEPAAPAEPAQDLPIVAAPAAQPEETANVIGPVFLTTGTTVLQRIAPIASVTVESAEVPVEAAAAPSDSADPAALPTATMTGDTTGASPVDVTVSIPNAAPTSAPTAATAAAQQSTALRLEITDGTGVDGVAKSVEQLLEESGLTISKTSSVPAGKQRRTVILYRDGFEAEAVRVSKLFNRPPSLVNNTHTRNSSDTSDVRVVLGSAAARDKELLVSKGGASSL